MTNQHPPLTNQRPSRLAALALEAAKTQLNVKEKPLGSNDGPEVRQYLKSVGLGPGYAWCMAFVYWCMQQACSKMSVSNPLEKTGGVLAGLNAAKGKKLLAVRDTRKGDKIAPADVRPGDIFVMEFTGGTGHTGFVERCGADGSLYTVEGNTNEAGSREGIGVFSKRRALSTIRAIIRVTE